MEGTPVTADILMDDIWQTLYNNRIIKLFEVPHIPFNSCCAYLDRLADYVSSLSWKDKYFHEFLMQMSRDQYPFSIDCQCCYNKHFLSISSVHDPETLRVINVSVPTLKVFKD